MGKLILLDPGHGGIIRGNYVTAPDKMYKHENGPTIYEGVWNREIVAKLKYALGNLGIDYIDVTNGSQEDVPLKERVATANNYAKAVGNENALYISVHANAGGGKGFEVFTSKGETFSDVVAEKWFNEMEALFPNKAGRVDLTDGDKDKEANFYVLKNTNCPAILTESFFMDTLEDAAEMLSYEGIEKVFQAHLKTIISFVKGELKPVKVEVKKTAKKNGGATVKKNSGNKRTGKANK